MDINKNNNRDAGVEQGDWIVAKLTLGRSAFHDWKTTSTDVIRYFCYSQAEYCNVDQGHGHAWPDLGDPTFKAEMWRGTPTLSGTAAVVADQYYLKMPDGSQIVRMQCGETWHVSRDGTVELRQSLSSAAGGSLVSNSQGGRLTQVSGWAQHTWDADNTAKWYPGTMTEQQGTQVVRTTYFHYTDDGSNLRRKRQTGVDYNSDHTTQNPSMRFQTTLNVYNSAGQLWFVVDPEGVNEFLAANGYDKGVGAAAPGDVCDLDDRTAVLDDNGPQGLKYYASAVYTYDGSGKVAGVTSHGGSCCGGGGAEGDYTFTYYNNPAWTGTSGTVQTWKTSRRVTDPSGLQATEFYNVHDELMYSIAMNGSNTAQAWTTHNVYAPVTGTTGDVQGRLLEVRHPSACAGYNLTTTTGGWVTAVTPNGTGTAGLVNVYSYEYNANNICTAREERVRQGLTGAESLVSATLYGDDSANRPHYLPIASYVYPEATTNRTYSSAIETTYTYTFTDSAACTGLVSRTVTYPAVSAGYNGSGSATTVTYHYGYLNATVSGSTYCVMQYNDWTQHEDGTVSYAELGTNWYDFGQIVKSIEDVKTGGGYSGTPPFNLSGDGMNLITTYNYYDSSGSPTLLKSVTSAGGQKTEYAYLCQRVNTSGKETTTALVTLVAPHMEGTNYATNSGHAYSHLQISVSDLAGRTTYSATGDPTTCEDGDLANDWNAAQAALADAFSGSLRSLTASAYFSYSTTGGAAGRLASTDQYYDLTASPPKKLTTEYAYLTTTGIVQQAVRAPDGTTSLAVSDRLGRTTDVFMGISTGTLSQVTTANLNRVGATFYDQAAPGSGSSGVGDGNVTASLSYFSTGGSDSFLTVYNYDWQNRLTASRGPDSAGTFRTLDNLGRTTTAATYASCTLPGGVITAGTLAAQSETRYDERGQVYQTVGYAVTNGAAGHTLATNFWYDSRGRRIKTKDANGLFSKTLYDTAGRTVASYISYDDNETAYADASTLTNDTVVEQSLYSYDPATGNLWLTGRFQRWDTATGTGSLNVPNTAGDNQPCGRVSYSVAWFDLLGRTTKTAFYGTNDNVPFTSQGADSMQVIIGYEYNEETEEMDPIYGTVNLNDFDPGTADFQYYSAGGPTVNSSDNCIVTTYTYDGLDGSSLFTAVTDNLAHQTRTYSDALGRTVRTVENFQGTGAVTETTPSDQNRTTQYVFDTKGRLAWLDALNPKGSGNGVEEQLTYYAYTNPYNASRPTAVAYPDMSPAMVSVDPNTLVVTLSGSDYVSTAFDLAGRPVSRTDQRGTTHQYAYDSAGRLEKDGVTTAGGDTDTAVLGIKFTYDTLGRRTKVGSYDNAACTGNPVNEVAWDYDGDTAGDLGWGGVKTSWQDHAGAAGGGDPSVQYAYADGATGTAAKFVRLSSVTYPGPATPRTVYFNYSTTGVGGAVGQLSNIANDAQGTTKHVQYGYLGAQTILSVGTPATLLSYGGNGRYPGFDRFGRVVWQKWGGDPGQDAYFYGYDRGSNRIWRAERRVRYQFQQSPDRGRDEGYAYDGLNRLVWAQRGTLTGTRTAGHPFAAYDGDFNLDGLVSVPDYSILDAWCNKGGDEWSEGDVYPDGTVNVNDYLLWLRVYQSQQPTRSVTHEWTWGLEALGNWGSYNVTTSAGTLTQTRTHDAANELLNFSTTGGSNWISPVHDAAGNMTRMPRPGDEGTAAESLLAVYDAWNRPVRFYKDSNSSGSLDVGTDALVLTSRYDGMSHRIQKIVAGGTTVTYDYYYNEAGQVLEERKTVGGGATQTYAQYIWDGRYIHSPACRFRDSDDNGSLDETLYYCNDANFNVTALVNTAGAVVERYQYTPYGSVTVCDSAWAPRAGNVSAYANDILFTGHRIDWETGLYGTQYRVYHPTIGRWVQRDPIGYADGLNLMSYTGGNPTGYIDSDGYAASKPDYAPLLAATALHLMAAAKAVDADDWVKATEEMEATRPYIAVEGHAGPLPRGDCCCKGENAKKCHIEVTHLAAIFRYLKAGTNLSSEEAGYPNFPQTYRIRKQIVWSAPGKEDAVVVGAVTRVQVKHEDPKMDTSGCRVRGDLEDDIYSEGFRVLGDAAGDFGLHPMTWRGNLNTSSGGNWYIDTPVLTLEARRWQGRVFQMHVTVRDENDTAIEGLEAWYGYAWRLKGSELTSKVWPPKTGVRYLDPKENLDRSRVAAELGLPFDKIKPPPK